MRSSPRHPGGSKRDGLEPNRVLLISGQAERYGADRSLLTLAHGLRDRGWDPTVAAPGPGPLVEDLRRMGIRVVFLDPGVVRRTLSWRGWARLLLLFPATVARVAVLARRTDIVHVNSTVILGGLVGGRLSRRPVLCHLRESYASHRRQWQVLSWLLRHTSDRTIAISSAIAEEAADARLASRTVLIHNSCDLPASPVAGAQTPPRILQVGRINDWKGQEVLAEAMALLNERGVAIDADIAGDAFPGAEGYIDRLEGRITELGLEGKIRLLGFVDDVAPLMTPAGIFVQPSTRPEPFGLALVEAMSRGMACIASDLGGPRDIIEPDRTGLLVPPRDAPALADAIERLWGDDGLRLELGRAAAADVAARFSPDREVAAVEAVYRELLGVRRP